MSHQSDICLNVHSTDRLVWIGNVSAKLPSTEHAASQVDDTLHPDTSHKANELSNTTSGRIG